MDLQRHSMEVVMGKSSGGDRTVTVHLTINGSGNVLNDRIPKDGDEHASYRERERTKHGTILDGFRVKL